MHIQSHDGYFEDGMFHPLEEIPPINAILEKLVDDDLTDEEREAFERADAEFARGETVDFEDFLQEYEMIAATGT